jgi:CheY-like chemotaxis protein
MKDSGAGASARPVRVLLVEDNPGDVYLLEKALKKRTIRYDLTLHTDGEQAIRHISGENCTVPDLILLDLNLPRRDGFDVLRTIRGKPALVGVPVGVFTSSEAERDKHRVALLGAERYIEKPANLEEFLEQVGQAVDDMLAAR